MCATPPRPNRRRLALRYEPAGIALRPARLPRQRCQPGLKGAPSVTFNTIQFAFNSAQLTPGSTATLRNIDNALNHELADQKSFLIEGHTNASGGCNTTWCYHGGAPRQSRTTLSGISV